MKGGTIKKTLAVAYEPGTSVCPFWGDQKPQYTQLEL